MSEPSNALALGSLAPPFSLLGTDGKKYSLDSFNGNKVLVVVFMSNKCAYSQAYEQRFMNIQRDYARSGVRLCAINSNDESSQPEEGYVQMQARARARQLSYPYLRDESQKVALAYHATCTPDIFLFDAQRCLRYHGRCDDNWRDASQVKRPELVRAIELTLQDKPIDFEMRPVTGNPIRWKKGTTLSA